MAIFQPTKPPHDGSPLSAWMKHLVAWMTSERVYILGWKVKQTSEGKFFTPPKVISGGAGDTWPPVAFDSTKGYSISDWVHIAPTDAIATTGIVDLDSGSLTVAPPGLWRPLKSVPAQIVVGGVTKYNVPKLPNSLANFWYQVQEYSLC
jgi:hypothetical protein